MDNFKTHTLAVQFFAQTEALKIKSHHLRDQVHRASSSIALNLAEGAAKPTYADRLKFYYQALGSLRECQSIFALLQLPSSHELNDFTEKLAAHIYKLIKALETGSHRGRIAPAPSQRVDR